MYMCCPILVVKYFLCFVINRVNHAFKLCLEGFAFIIVVVRDMAEINGDIRRCNSMNIVYARSTSYYYFIKFNKISTLLFLIYVH